MKLTLRDLFWLMACCTIATVLGAGWWLDRARWTRDQNLDAIRHGDYVQQEREFGDKRVKYANDREEKCRKKLKALQTAAINAGFTVDSITHGPPYTLRRDSDNK